MKGFYLVLDYGHGGLDPGGSYKGRTEARDNLRLGKLIKENLQARGICLVETRRGDEFVSLESRVAIANRFKKGLFISIHRNAFKPELACGVEAYTYPNKNDFRDRLGQDILKGLGTLGFINRGLKKGNFYVLRKTNLPAILLEVGFIDKTSDNDLFDSKLNLISRLISQEIIKRVV